MDGSISEGWYVHPKLGLIKIYRNSTEEWAYKCYSDSGTRVLSKEKSLDKWTWALCQPQ